jgi:hypothetical protein
MRPLHPLHEAHPLLPDGCITHAARAAARACEPHPRGRAVARLGVVTLVHQLAVVTLVQHTAET